MKDLLDQSHYDFHIDRRRAKEVPLAGSRTRVALLREQSGERAFPCPAFGSFPVLPFCVHFSLYLGSPWTKSLQSKSIDYATTPSTDRTKVQVRKGETAIDPVVPNYMLADSANPQASLMFLKSEFGTFRIA